MRQKTASEEAVGTNYFTGIVSPFIIANLKP